MIIKHNIDYIKSDTEIVRLFHLEYNDFNIDQMEIFKNVIIKYFMSDRISYTTDREFVICANTSFIEEILLKHNIRIYEELLSVLKIEFHLRGRPQKEGKIFVKAPKKVEGVTPKHIKQCVIRILQKIADDIFVLLSAIKSAQIRENYFIQDIAIWDSDFTGIYNFDVMKVDFGKSNPKRDSYKVARCWMKYIQYNTFIEGHPVFSFIERVSKINLTLLQLLLRFNVYRLSNNSEYVPSGIQGELTRVERNNLNSEYIVDFFNNTLIPDDISELFRKYYQLSDREKAVFFDAANTYCEGLKQVGAKAITYFVIAIETISAFNACERRDTASNKIDMISTFINTNFPNSPLEHTSVERMYSIRSAYVHNGIANNNFLDEVFMKSIIDNSNSKLMERVANYALVLWLKAR